MRIRTLLGTQRDRFVVHRTVGLLGAVACALLLLASAQAAQAATISVNTTNDELNSDGDCSLREAIQSANGDFAADACAVGNDADTIDVPAGTYALSIPGASEGGGQTGDLDIFSDLTITGAGAATTVIDGAGLDRVLDIAWTLTVEISGVTIRGGDSSGGTGIRNRGGSPAFKTTLDGVTVTANTGPSGGPEYGPDSVRNQGGTLTLIDSSVTNNTMGINNIGALTLENTEVTDNSGSGIDNYGTVTLNDSTVSGNNAVYDGDGVGGGITNQGGDATLNNSAVTGNGALVGGGIYSAGSVTLNNSTVSGNSASIYAGGMEAVQTVYGGGAALDMNDSVVTANTAPTAAGILVTIGQASISDSTIAQNYGGGMALGADTSVTLTRATVSGNTAPQGGGVYVSGTAGDSGGGLTLQDSAVTGNTASDGNGGGIYADPSATVALNASTVSGNRAIAPSGTVADKGEGAGLWIQKDATLHVLDSTISDNTSDTNGGGIWSAGATDITDSTVSHNFAPNGGGLHNHGGSLDLTNTTVTGNSATQGGGILDHDVAGGPSGGTTVKSSTIAQNSATSTGGGLKNLQASPPSGPYGEIALKDTIVANNEVNQTPSECAGPITSGIEGFSGAYNLIEMIDSTPPQECTISGDTAGNITGQDPKLGLLADNTGPTKTHMLALGSPALNQGSSSCPTQDQRGTSRPQDFACDIGAVERDPLVDLDADHDGCADDRETDTNAAQGGLRDPSNFWDFMDVPTGTGFARDKRVSGGDIAAVVARFGSNDATPGQFNKQSDPLSTPNATILPPGARSNYHPAYDRGGTIVGGDPWDLMSADGSIAGGDISATVIQFGHNCVGS